MSELVGKVALVTGAGRGIGRACAVELTRRGARVVINDRTGGDDLLETIEAIRAVGQLCHQVECDVFDRAGCQRAVDETLAACGQIDILVSVPAYSRRGLFLDYSPEEFERTIAGTLTAGFHLSQLVARHMVERGGGGKMLFISSVLGEMPIGSCMPYATAKAGLNHMTRTIAVEMSPHRINVNAIEPGWIDTPGERETFGDDTIAAEAAKLPWGRMGRPEEIAKAAAFLVSPDADYITGVVLPVDGLYRFKDCVVDQTEMLRDNQ